MTPMDFFSRCKLADLEEFGSHFESCKRAFRLELLQSYAEESEKTYLDLYKSGCNQRPAAFNAEWGQILSAAEERGAEFRRARFRQSNGLSPYMLFEFDWGYRKNIELGEKIVQFKEGVLEKVRKQLGFIVDFWLFDDKDGYLMIYDIDGQFLGVLKVETKDVKMLSNVEKLVWKESEAINWN